MGRIYGDDSSSQCSGKSPGAHEEKIYVSVRLRPLSKEEFARNDISEWECINDYTIKYRNNLGERSFFPTSSTFDRVFGGDCSTHQVYEEGAKKVALSVVSGINSSIFAYGQTSSGKTYTMSGITQHTIADIFDYVGMLENEREFELKFSAMEIYNESVRDLLSSDTTPLRLLDDPERGTVVDKLMEVTLTNWNHLKELLSVCEAQRQIGETALNEVSSRSHQIIRLTVESAARNFTGPDNAGTLAATVSFVDLAGSERASQASTAGTRLKEGCHINRSLLTLGTVIRKLSKGRYGHIPYRDSKLTRILQNSLGGNSRTAIICTMSPARSHVEQSKNTLLFANCAKEVSTNARVNVAVSDKALVKHLQSELARLENELRSIASISSMGHPTSALREKELLIEKMDKEIKDLTQQRDLAQSRIEDLLRTGESSRSSDKSSWMDDSSSEVSEVVDLVRSEIGSTPPYSSDRCDSFKCMRSMSEQLLHEYSEDQFLSDGISPRVFIDKFFGPDPCQGWEKLAQKTIGIPEDSYKEVQCIETKSNDNNLLSNALASPQEENMDEAENKVEDPKRRETIDFPYLIELSPCSSDTDISCTRTIEMSKSRSCRAIMTTLTSPSCSEKAGEQENVSSFEFENDFLRMTEHYLINPSELKTSDESESASSKNDKGLNIKDEDANELNDMVQNVDPNTKLDVKIPETNQDSVDSPSNWDFEKQRKQIIELWDLCNAPLIHRTCFFLLFKGDPSDAVYMEVELRRLSFLKEIVAREPATSERALYSERKMLAKQIMKMYSTKQREFLYQKWGINLDSKQRKQQLSRMLWSDTQNVEHVEESAKLVAKLVGFVNSGQEPKEMIGLSISPHSTPSRSKSLSWKQPF